MRKLLLGCAIVFISVASIAQQPTDCSTFNHTFGPFEHSGDDEQQHATGGHEWVVDMEGTCSYSGTASTSGPVQCSSTSTADPDGAVFTNDAGSLDAVHVLDSHDLNNGTKSGVASSSNSSSVSDSEAAVAVRSCVGSCATNITISGTGNGAGFIVNFAPSPLWSDAYHYVNTCGAESLPTLPSTCQPNTPPPTQSTQNGGGPGIPRVVRGSGLTVLATGRIAAPGVRRLLSTHLIKDLSSPTQLSATTSRLT